MLSRESLVDFIDRHTKAKEQLVARVNVCQGAIDAGKVLLAQYDEQAAVAKGIVDALKPAPVEAK